MMIMTHLIMEDVNMKHVFNLIFGIYIALSFVLVLLPYCYSYLSTDLINWYYNKYELIDKIAYINFIFAYFISIILFYFNGYEDGKKTINLDK